MDIEHMPVGARLGSALGIESAARDQRRVVGARPADRPHRGIGAARLLLDDAIEELLDGPFAAAEIGVPAGGGEAVEALDAVAQIRNETGGRRFS